MTEEPIEVFFSYSHRDEEFKDELVKHLSILQRQGVVSGWHDRMIAPGTEWDREIDHHLSSADIILLMLSSDFLHSEYCWGVEVQKAMRRHEAGEAVVIPVVLRWVDWKDAPFARLQALPKNAKPIRSWADADEAYTNVCEGIRAAVKTIRERRRKRMQQVLEVSNPPVEKPNAAPTQMTAEEFFARGVEKWNKGDYQGAIADYDQAIKLKPDYAEPYNNRGLARSALGDNQGAIADYEESLRLKNSEPWIVYNNRGVARSDLGDNQGAISDYDQAIKLKPDYSSAYNNRGSARNALGDNQGAISDYDQAIKLKPDYSLAYNNRGLVRSALGDKQGAIADYDQAIKLKPDFATAYNGRGAARSALGDKQGAITDYEESLRLKNPEPWLVYNNRGSARKALGDNQGAIADYDQAIKLKLDFADPYYNRGSIRKDQGNKQGAIADFQKAADLYKQQGNSKWHQNALDQLKKLQR